MSTRLHKRFKPALLGGLVTSLLFAHGIVGAEPEVEPNDAKAQAQVLAVPVSGATVSAMIGSASGGMSTDLDIYAFDAKAGDVPSIRLVSDGAWDPFMALYDSAGNVQDMNDDTDGLDPRIDRHRIAADGRYYVAVSAVPRYLGDNFSVLFPDAAVGGGYSLMISGVTAPEPVPAPQPDPTPAPQPDPVPPPSSGGSDARIVSIKVRHWTAADNVPENRGRKNLIPVAIISSPDFDAMTVNPSTLTFGATGDESSLHHCNKKGRTVRFEGRRDNLKDMVCYFKNDVAGFEVGDVQAFLKGATVDGEAIEGTGALRSFRVSNPKEDSWHERHKRGDRDDRGNGRNPGKRGDRD
jgi:hypothetical protein